MDFDSALINQFERSEEKIYYFIRIIIHSYSMLEKFSNLYEKKTK